MAGDGQVRRVLMTADTVGGVWTYSLDLSRALGAHGIEVALATMGAPLTSLQRRDALACRNVRIYESAFQLEWMENPWNDVFHAGGWLLTIENDVEPDIVHLNGYAHGNLPWRAPHLVVGHSCVLSWWRSVKGGEVPAEWHGYRQIVEYGIHGADFLITPTRAMLQELQQLYGPKAATAVIPNGRACSPVRVGEKQPFVLTAGRIWDEAKNIAALADIADRIAWPILAAGDAHRPGGGTVHPDNIRLLGVLAPEDLTRYYEQAAIYCAPARYEPFGLSILEAASAGCALVLGDIASLRENWQDAAIFVPPTDRSALAGSLQNLIRDAGLRRAMGDRARERSQHFTAERMCSAYLNLYSDLIAARTAVRAA